MPSRLTCGALLAAGLLSSGLSVANAEALYEFDGTIPKMTATTSADTQLIVVSGAAGFYPRVAFAAMACDDISQNK